MAVHFLYYTLTNCSFVIWIGKQQPSSGVIERRYGYIPNPRWPKSFSSYYKPYDPVGVGNTDRSSIPGVVFREKQKSKLDVCDISCEHSYIESDFPMLHISGTERWAFIFLFHSFLVIDSRYIYHLFCSKGFENLVIRWLKLPWAVKLCSNISGYEHLHLEVFLFWICDAGDLISVWI